MARLPRVEVPGALYHVIARGNQRRRVFRGPRDYEAYLRRLAAYQRRHEFVLCAYVLMPNHVHLLLEPGRVPVSKIMQGLQQSYVAYFNRTYRTVGHVFQGRYKALLCDRDRYLLALVRYLHLNPTRAGLVENPKAWRWSSHHQYLGKAEEPRVVTGAVLGQFHRDPSLARKQYAEFVRDAGVGEHDPTFYQAIGQRFIGDERFVEQLEKAQRLSVPPLPLAVSLREVEQAVAERLGLTLAELHRPGRQRRPALARSLVAHLARGIGGIPLVRVAQRYRRDPVTLTLGVQALLRRIERESPLAATVGQMEQDLRRGRKRRYKITNV